MAPFLDVSTAETPLDARLQSGKPSPDADRHDAMPAISEFFGIAVRMFFSDHPPPHFHVAYQRYRAVIAIESGVIIGGALPPAVHRLVREWAERHRVELLDNWGRARARKALQRIPGADVE